MADWSYGPNAPEAVKIWSARLFKQSITKTIAWKLANISSSVKSEDNIVQILDDTAKGPGQTVTYDLIAKLGQAGVVGDNEIAGSEEALVSYTTSMSIDQLRFSVKLKGAMSQQRVPIAMRETAKVRLGDLWAERDNLALINQLCGNTNQTDVRYTGLQATVAPDAAHQIGANGKTGATVAATEAALVAGDRFTVDLLLDAVYIAHTNTFPIKPIRLNGLEINGVMILHPAQVRSLKKNYSLGQWGDIQKAAMNGGQITGNPIFIGSIGMLEGVVLHEDAMIPYGSGAGTGSDAAALILNQRNLLGTANVARAVFCGAQAACMATGRAYDNPNKFKWFEELLDAGNQIRITAGKIGGLKKNVFNSQDYATVTISSFES